MMRKLATILSGLALLTSAAASPKTTSFERTNPANIDVTMKMRNKSPAILAV